MSTSVGLSAEDRSAGDCSAEDSSAGDGSAADGPSEDLTADSPGDDWPEAERKLPSSARRLFEAGDEVSGRYRIQEFVARGGMGEVYSALDTELGQTVALKAVRPEVALHSQTLRRFRREINLSRKVTHHNVCRIYDAGTHYDEENDVSIRFLTMELLEGLTLTRHLRRHGALSTEDALPLVVQIASGLGAAHEAGVVHRDFKTSNVLLAETPRGLRAVITDFGLSQSLDDDGLTPIDSDKLTGTGQLMGTLAYLAPEQLEGKRCSASTDLYSLGVVLYQMVTGRLPFDGGSPLMAALKRLHEDPPDPLTFVPDLDPVWRDMLLRCLHRDPNQRFQSTTELLEALGVEMMNDSSTAIRRSQLLERLREEAMAEARADAEEHSAAPGTRTDTVPLPERSLPMWKAVLLAVAVGLAVLGITTLVPQLTRPPQIQVLVAEPVVRGDNADFVASNLEAAALRGLASLEGLRPLDSSTVQGAIASPVELLRTAAADELVQLTARDVGREWQVEIKRFGQDGTVRWAEEIRVVQEDPRVQADAIQAAIRRAYPDREVLEGADLDISSEDYSEFLRLRFEIQNAPQDIDWAATLADLRGIRERAPGFLELQLKEAEVAGYLFSTTRDTAYRDWAYERIEVAQDLAPMDPRPIQTEIRLALHADGMVRAEKAVERMRSIAPGEVELLISEAMLHRARGELEAAATKIERACEIRPSRRCLYDLADYQMGVGSPELALSTLQRLVSLWPEYYFAREKLAEWEMLYGDMERARQAYEVLVKRDHPEPPILNGLALVRMIQGDFEGSLKIFEQLTARYPDNPYFALSQADALKLAGRNPEAVEMYKRTLELVDPASAASWIDWSVRAQALAHLGRKAAAAQAANRSLSLSLGGDYQPHLWAALVFAVNGDWSQAELHARRARDLGARERWFALPWLEPLQDPSNLF